MSAIGTWQTFPMRLRMSAIGSKADITVGRVSSETHPYALLTFLIIAFVGDLTAKVRRERDVIVVTKFRFLAVYSMSALPPKADIRRCVRNAR